MNEKHNITHGQEMLPVGSICTVGRRLVVDQLQGQAIEMQNILEVKKAIEMGRCLAATICLYEQNIRDNEQFNDQIRRKIEAKLEEDNAKENNVDDDTKPDAQKLEHARDILARRLVEVQNRAFNIEPD